MEETMNEQSSDEPTSPLPFDEPIDVKAEEEVTIPVINGQPVEKIRFIDYGEIRVVFDAKTGSVLGTVPAKKAKKVKNG